ncbi:uncharacterized protein LOC143208317 isoform X2 [Lasioglossum baleicum]|uniref:uncharacterized protein LOC143208317 isoform X2 n=1 Tax=Lasioglossum baleicum TaxID=434251 RepID=UPI003FCC5AFD
MAGKGGKGFRVKVRLDLHAVTCPGVWLCPSGKVALRITSLGSTLESHRVSPIFPLLFHNEFNFKKTFTRLAALTELQRKLEQQTIRAELIQWFGPCNRVVALATFETNLADVLYPLSRCKCLLPGVDVDLLMDPTRSFPGIIAPKIEISTRTVIEEVLGVLDGWSDEASEIDSTMTISKRTLSAPRRRPTKGIIRQKRVCHSRTHPGLEVPRPVRYRCADENADVDSLPICHQPEIGQRCRTSRRCKRIESLQDVHEQPRDHEVSVGVCENARLFDRCPVCSLYKCYFDCDCEQDVEHNRQSAGGDPEYTDELRCCDAAQTFAKSSRARCSRRDGNRYCCLDKDRGTKCRISECDRSTAGRDHRDASQGFYGNLEKFYKGMYKQAKLRARETDNP